MALGGLDFDAGKHVKSDGTYSPGCIRRFGQKLNNSVKEFVKTFPPLVNLCYSRALYIYKSNGTTKYSYKDFSESTRLTPEELLKMLYNGESAKRSLLETVVYLIKHKD